MTSIPRKNAAINFTRTQARLVVFNAVNGSELKTSGQMTPLEQQLSADWFSTYIDGLQDDIDALTRELPGAAAQDKDDLIGKRSELEVNRDTAMQKQNAVFQSNTDSLRPPTQDVIAETTRLTDAVAARIAAEKRAQAIVALVNDLAGVFSKLTR